MIPLVILQKLREWLKLNIDHSGLHENKIFDIWTFQLSLMCFGIHAFVLFLKKHAYQNIFDHQREVCVCVGGGGGGNKEEGRLLKKLNPKGGLIERGLNREGGNRAFTVVSSVALSYSTFGPSVGSKGIWWVGSRYDRGQMSNVSRD